MAREHATVPDKPQPAQHSAELADWLVAQVKFFLEHTSLGSTPQVPEVVLRLGTEAVPLWHAIERKLPPRAKAPPYWAFAWPAYTADCSMPAPQNATAWRILSEERLAVLRRRRRLSGVAGREGRPMKAPTGKSFL
jgi:hypothetical protein